MSSFANAIVMLAFMDNQKGIDIYLYITRMDITQ